MSRWTHLRDSAENVGSMAVAPMAPMVNRLTSTGAQASPLGHVSDIYNKAALGADVAGGIAGGAWLAAPEMFGAAGMTSLGMDAGVDAAGSAALGEAIPSSIGSGIYGAGEGIGEGALGGAGAAGTTGGAAGFGNLGLGGVGHTLGAMGGWPAVIGGLGVLSAYNSYQNRKAIEKANQQARDDMTARQHAIDVNPITGNNQVDKFGRPVGTPPTMTPYLGTPKFNPFIAQSPNDRLAFGPSPWQLGSQQARGGPAGSGPMGPLGSLARGPGGGQSDQIPAMLSDGEYVMDASTVSDLGDGSTDEGARRLDKMRQNVRTHKRSKGSTRSIPPKAKAPEAYLKGK